VTSVLRRTRSLSQFRFSGTCALDASLWEAVLPEEVLRLPEELGRVDALLDDPAFFAPFAPPIQWDPAEPPPGDRIGDFAAQSLVAQPIAELEEHQPQIDLHRRRWSTTTLMKLTSRCGTSAVNGCNEALLVNARRALRRAEAKAAQLAAGGK
jgi:IS5 family transposase